MTGTVTGITGYQWHAGGQWPVISANLLEDFGPHTSRNWGEAGPGPCCLADSASLEIRHERRMAVSDSELRDARQRA
jgi:hypothetical protein